MARRRLVAALDDGRLPGALRVNPGTVTLLKRLQEQRVVHVALPMADIRARGVPTVREAEDLHAIGVVLREGPGYRLSVAKAAYLAE